MFARDHKAASQRPLKLFGAQLIVNLGQDLDVGQIPQGHGGRRGLREIVQTNALDNQVEIEAVAVIYADVKIYGKIVDLVEVFSEIVNAVAGFPVEADAGEEPGLVLF